MCLNIKREDNITTKMYLKLSLNKIIFRYYSITILLFERAFTLIESQN